MGIAFDHLEGLVAEHFGYLGGHSTVHGQVRGAGVPEIVPAEIFDPCGLQSCLPGPCEVYGLARPSTWEDEVRINAYVPDKFRIFNLIFILTQSR